MAFLPSGTGADYTPDSVSDTLGNIVELALVIAGGIAVIYILVGAFYYLTAYGNEEKANQGKKTITWAIVGLVVILLSRVIIATVWSAVSSNPVDLPF